MQKPNYALLVFIVLLATVVGAVGGGVMGGLTGYYTAQATIPQQVQSAPASSTNPNSSQPLLQAAPPATTNLTLKEDSAVIDAVRKAEPAVVTVINQMRARSGFFGGGSAPTASGSGVIVDKRGYIVTNNHVVEGEQVLEVIFADGSQANASLVGADSVADIAVLKVDGPVPAVAEMGDSNALEPGQLAIAIGSPLGDFRGTVTVGIISGLNRSVGRQQGLIQTDAAINNGNSGGPLLNSLGQVIGLNTLVVRSTSEGNVAEGLGFAIPSNVVRAASSQLIANGKIDRPYIGVNYQDLDPQVAGTLNIDPSNGVMVTKIDPNSPATRAGIREGDVILSMDSQTIDADHPFQSVLFSHNVGDTVTLTIFRNGKQIQIKVNLVLKSG